MATNLAVLAKAGIKSINTKSRQRQLRWTGQLSRMPKSPIPKQLFYVELAQGSRPKGRSRKRYRDKLEVSIEYFLQMCFEGKWLQNRLRADEKCVEITFGGGYPGTPTWRFLHCPQLSMKKFDMQSLSHATDHSEWRRLSFRGKHF